MKIDAQPLLLIEDDENDVFFMQRAMKDSGLTNPLHVVTDGQEAIDYLSGAGSFADRQQHPLPSLIFLDLKLPRRGGFDVLTWLREREPFASLVVLVLTTSAEERDLLRAYRLGANAYLVKPPTPVQLTRLLDSVRAFWFTQNEFAPGPPEGDAEP